MKVPFLDIRAQNASIWTELQQSTDPVLSEARFILGPAVEDFEKRFAEYIGVDHCVGVNSGTSALHMALIACGVALCLMPGNWIIGSIASLGVLVAAVPMLMASVRFAYQPSDLLARRLLRSSLLVLPAVLAIATLRVFW